MLMPRDAGIVQPRAPRPADPRSEANGPRGPPPPPEPSRVVLVPCAARREPNDSIRLLVLMSAAVNQAFVYAKNKTAGFPIRRSEIIGGWHESRNGGCCFDSGPKATLFVCRKRFVQFYYFGSTWFACESGFGGRGCGCHLPRPRPFSQLNVLAELLPNVRLSSHNRSEAM